MNSMTRRMAVGAVAIAIAIIGPVGGSSFASAAVHSPRHSAESKHKTTGYVALGDSFSSGEGAGKYLPGTNTATDQCHRSARAYGPLIKAATRHLGPLSFVACSGAATQDLYTTNPAHSPEAPQLNALKKDTKAVSLTIGGNDVVFAQVARACVQSVRTVGFDCSQSPALKALVDSGLSTLAGKSTATVPGGGAIVPIAKVLSDIHRKSRHAKIYLAGYPKLFGKKTTHYSVDQSAPSGSSCVVNPATAARVDYADAQWINDQTHRLNAVLRDAVKRAKAAGVNATYVSASTFLGHGLCDADASWIQPVLVNPATGGPLSESLHPTKVGQAKGYLRAFRKAGL